jgi:uncharacterized membrane protein YqaE (UPF0057 family)
MARDGAKDFWRVLVALVLPPAGVLMQVGLGVHFWINLVLCFLFWFPAQIHAVWVIATVGPDGREVPDGMQTFISLLVAAVIPPIGVAMKRGLGVALLINVVLTCLFWLPGSLHALWVITADDRRR